MTDQPAATPVKPDNRVAQTNHQTLHVHIHNGSQGSNLSGRIVGLAMREEGSVPLSHCEVHLFFGPVGEHPVATTRTDGSGAFAFDDLPPGFYGLRLSQTGGHLIHLHNLRVRPGETCQPRLLLTGHYHLPRFIAAPAEEAGLLAESIRMEEPV